MRKVAIVMGSKSDLPVAEKAVGVLRDYGVQMEVRVLSAHRCPNEAREFAASAREGGFSVILAFAGMAAHLAGAMAANTTLPVIGVPCSGTKLDGMDALLSTVQMPSGIPVATVAVDGGKNAALLAVQIMAVSDAELAQKLDDAGAGRRAARGQRGSGALSVNKEYTSRNKRRAESNETRIYRKDQGCIRTGQR